MISGTTGRVALYVKGELDMIKNFKGTKIVLYILFALSYFVPFYSYEVVHNGEKSRQLKLGVQLISEYWGAFGIFILVILFYFFFKKKGSEILRATLLFLAFLYVLLVIFTTNIFNVPFAVMREFLTQQFQQLSYGFYLNLILGILIYGLSFVREKSG